MNQNIKTAIRTLGIYTAGRFDVWALAGPSRASCRAHVMSEIKGSKMPQSKSGVTAIRSEFYRALGLENFGACEAHREDEFIRICKAETL